jgi:outer membrane protein assembly factor BamB
MKRRCSILNIAARLCFLGAFVVQTVCAAPRPVAEPKAGSKFVEQFKFSGGIVVALDFEDGKSIADLATDGPFLIHGLMSDDVRVAAARRAIRRAGVYGKVSCDSYNGRDLPYVDNLVNLVLRSDSCQVPESELMRVLVPGGRLVTQGPGGWKKKAKPIPGGMDEWNQFLHGADNNGVSLDDVGPPQRLRWHDTPEFGRSKSLSPSFTSMVSANGILFSIEDWATTEDINAPVAYHLVARDAFNGIRLWKLPLKRWSAWQTQSIKSIPTQQQRCLAAIGNVVYCCPEFGGPITAFAARNGAPRQVYAGTERTTEFAIAGHTLYGIKGAPYKVSKNTAASGEVTLFALDLRKGSMLWSQAIATEYTGGTLAVKGRRLVYHSQAGVTCLDSKTGNTLWTETIDHGPPGKAAKTSKAAKKPKASKRKKLIKDYSVFNANEHPTIVLTDDMVFCGIREFLSAKSLADGKTVWTSLGTANYMKSSDLFVANGLVWNRDLKGRDPQTGAVVRSLTQEMNGPMSHDRCYRNRITHRYYLNSASGGSDFVKLDGNAETPNPWARSTCGLAVMPANGMVYNGPYVCQCAIGTMATGVNGFYNGSGNTDKRFSVKLEPRLVKGPAFGKTLGKTGGPAATAADWPSYRYSSMRSAVTSATTPKELAPRWQVDIGSQPTAPTVAGDTVYVADRDSHTLHALNRETGQTRWTFIAAGRIDSPPSYHQGLVLFGGRCGRVYCLRASDGQLVWKFSGLPERRLICDTGRLESAWPVNGSIMIFQDTAYFAAGRSTFLDGGIGMFGLDPHSGSMKHGKILQGPYQDEQRAFPIPSGQTFQLEGCKAGIFSSAGNELFIRHQAFNQELEPINLAQVKTLHLMASPGFLNDSPQHRTYWTVDRDLRYGGPTAKFNSGPAGDTIAFDGKLFYEIRGYAPGRNLPGRGRDLNPRELYSVFSGSHGYDQGGKENPKSIPALGGWEKRWNTPTPFAGHAIAAAANTLMAAGVPMHADYTQKDTDASYAGKKGGIAWLLDTKDGKKLQELTFKAPPVWDGIAIARGSYFISLKDGTVACLGGR